MAAHPALPGTSSFFGRLAETITKFSGSTAAFTGAAGIVLVWAATGPLFKYSDRASAPNFAVSSPI